MLKNHVPGRARQFVHIMFNSVGIFGRHQVQKHKASLGVLAILKTTSDQAWQFVHILFSFFAFLDGINCKSIIFF